jgi:hypothetical protein
MIGRAHPFFQNDRVILKKGDRADIIEDNKKRFTSRVYKPTLKVVGVSEQTLRKAGGTQSGGAELHLENGNWIAAGGRAYAL